MYYGVYCTAWILYYLLLFVYSFNTDVCSIYTVHKEALKQFNIKRKTDFCYIFVTEFISFFKNDVFLEVPSFKYHRFRTTWGWHRIAFLLHCPKNNLNSLIKTEPLTVGADARFYHFLLLVSVPKYIPITIYIYIPLHPLQPRQA